MTFRNWPSRIGQTLLLLMVIACAAMAAFLIHLRHQAHARLEAPLTSSVPLAQTPGEPLVTATLLMPDDKTGQLNPVSQTLALPQDESARARTLIHQLIAAWRTPTSTHLIHSPAGQSPADPSPADVDSVFLLPVPNQPGHQLAVVNLNSAFPQAQPSGIEPETLTLLAIIQTLHANLPTITEVRFLVNGQPRATLAGHADLTRTYLAQNTPSGPKS
jgi:hypothetical protein